MKLKKILHNNKKNEIESFFEINKSFGYLQRFCGDKLSSLENIVSNYIIKNDYLYFTCKLLKIVK